MEMRKLRMFITVGQKIPTPPKGIQIQMFKKNEQYMLYFMAIFPLVLGYKI